MILRLTMPIAVCTALSLLLGCASLRNGMRRDFDDSQYMSDSPTVGGTWSERGLLSDNMEESPYASRYEMPNRGPASDGPRKGRDGDSWVNDDQDGARIRDRGREPESNGLKTPAVGQAQARYKNGRRATRSDFIDESTNENSLWASDGQTNYYFTKNKIRGVGDIVSVTIEPGMFKDISFEIGRTLSQREREHELDLAQDRIRAKALGMPDPDAPEAADKVQSAAAAPNRSSDTEAQEKKSPDDVLIRQATLADIDLSRSIDLKPGELIMAEILERYPNGNCKIRGSKKVFYHGGYRVITMLGIVKGSDINEADTIASGKLYEYRLEALR